MISSTLLPILLPAPPAILEFVANPPGLAAGQTATLTWRLGGGKPTAVTLEDDISGARPKKLLGRDTWILPQAVRRQNFILKVRNESGTVTASLTLVPRGLCLLAGGQGGAGSQDGFQDGASFLGPHERTHFRGRHRRRRPVGGMRKWHRADHRPMKRYRRSKRGRVSRGAGNPRSHPAGWAMPVQ